MISTSATAAPHAFGVSLGSRDARREEANLETARRYLAAIEASSTDNGEGESVDAFFAPDIIQDEFPNRLVPSGARRNLNALREAAARGKAVIKSQRFEVQTAHAVGDTVILELLWVGTLRVPVGSLSAGAEMRAHFAMFLEFRDGLIHRQRNYDCFEPF